MMIRRALTVCGALSALGLLTVANAAEEEHPPTVDDAAPQALPACPPAEGETEPMPACPPPAVTEAPPPLPPPPPPAPPPPMVVKHEKKHNVVFAPSEVQLMTGAGPSNYFGSGSTTNMDVGAAWDARATFGARSIIALEAGYNGALNGIDVGSFNRGHVSSQGFDGTFRLQVPTRVEPYIFGGVGYNHMSVTLDGVPTVLQATNDNQLTVPAGGGLAAYLGRHATLDLRGTYRYIPDNEISAMSGRSLHQWVAQARLGYTF